MKNCRKSPLFSSLVNALMDEGRFTLNWGEDRINNRVNCDSFEKAKSIAKSATICGYHSYMEIKCENPYLIHVCKEPQKNRKYKKL